MWHLAAVLVFALWQAPDYASEGLKALDGKNYEAAVQLFTKATDADPKDYAAHFNLGLAYSLLNKNAEAIEEYRRTLAIKPDLYEAELNLGIVLLEQKQPGDAIGQLLDAVARKPAEFRPNFYLAEAYLAAGDPGRAEEAYKKAGELNPKSAAVQLGLGRTRARQDRLTEGAANFRQAAELDPDYKDALLELATLYEKSGQTPEAIEIYKQFPDNVAVRERLGELLIEAGKPAEAVPHLEWAVAKSPTSANRLALATAYRRSGALAKAAPLLRQAAADEPRNADLIMTYGRALRDLRNFQGAADQFSRVTQMTPGSVEAWNELAAMLTSLEDYPQALAALDRVRTLGAEIAGNYYLRAIILDKTRQIKPAIESYQQFLAASQGRNPNDEFIARQRVRILQDGLKRQ